MPLDNLFVFDVETIPDKDHHDGDKFPIPPFHKVVAVAFLEAVMRSSRRCSRSSWRFNLAGVMPLSVSLRGEKVRHPVAHTAGRQF